MHTRSFLRGSSVLKAAAFAGAMFIPAMAAADFVTLKSADGTVNLSGKFLAFEDNFYLIETELGELRVSAERMSCEGAGCPVIELAEAEVQISGSDAVAQGMMPLLLEGFAGYLDADATVTVADGEGKLLAELVADAGFGDPISSYLVSSSGSANAFADLLDKSSEIGMSARRILPEEAESLFLSGAGDMLSPQQEHILAVDSLVVITHPDNPVQSLTSQQLADVFAGRVTNWKQLGGNDAPISVVDRPANSSTRAIFMEAIFQGAAPAPLPNAAVFQDNTSAAIAVNEDKNAIGIVSFAFQRGAKPLTIVNECGLAMVPDAFSARTEEYGLQRRLYLYNRADNISEASQELLTFATSEAADGVIAKAGFIDLGVDRKEQTLDSPRARSLSRLSSDRLERETQRNMMAMMSGFDRLSTTFRFRTGSALLDERGLVDMERLTRYLETQPKGTKVVVVGFTDSVGPFENNKRLSERRASQVLHKLQTRLGTRHDGIDFALAGYSELAPSACNSNPQGRQINRRVEIWISSPEA